MGKPTGFLEYDRGTGNGAAPLTRIRHFHEFYTSLGEEEQKRQGARCMECGVPFCQSGFSFCASYSSRKAFSTASIIGIIRTPASVLGVDI